MFVLRFFHARVFPQKNRTHWGKQLSIRIGFVWAFCPDGASVVYILFSTMHAVTYNFIIRRLARYIHFFEGT